MAIMNNQQQASPRVPGDYSQALNTPWIVNMNNGTYKLLPTWAVGLLRNQAYGYAKPAWEESYDSVPIAPTPAPIGWTANLRRQFLDLFSDTDAIGTHVTNPLNYPRGEDGDYGNMSKAIYNATTPEGQQTHMYAGMAPWHSHVDPRLNIDNIKPTEIGPYGFDFRDNLGQTLTAQSPHGLWRRSIINWDGRDTWGVPTMPTKPVSAYTRRLMERTGLTPMIQTLSDSAAQSQWKNLLGADIPGQYAGFSPESGQAYYPSAAAKRPSQWRIASQK